MGATPLRLYYTKLNRSKEQLAKGNLQACLMNLAEAINIKLSQQFLKRDMEMMDEDLFNFAHKLTMHKLYKEQFGPVSLQPGQEKEWLGFLDQLVAVDEGPFKKLNEGQDLLDAGDIEGARRIFSFLLDDYPDDAGLAIDIGDRYMDKDHFPDAQEAYLRAMKIDPNTLITLNRLAMAYRKEGKLSEALKIYKQAIKLSPKDEGLYYNMARVVYDMKRPDVATKLIETSLTINPEFEAGKQLLAHLKKAAQKAEAAPA